MPYTKRVPHYGSPKELIDYALDEKNNGEKVAVASSINCDVETALYEFKKVQNKFNMSGNRVAYHIIQSFSPLDNITPKQANEIGVKVCKKLYPEYQCVISTHIDRGHIHNHIVLNAINLNGKKLEDRLANSKEGLYGLSNISDKISSEYGCFIMPKRIIRTVKGKNYYYQYKSKTWKAKIKEDIENILYKCSNMEEFLNELSLYGYEVKKGKNISVKCIGMKKFSRLSTISPKYEIKNLYSYFRKNNNIKLASIKLDRTEFNSRILEMSEESKKAIEKSQLATEGRKYNEYQKTRYLEVKRFYRLKEQLEFLDQHKINSFYDLENEIKIVREKIKEQNIWLKKNKREYKEIVENTEKCQDYIKLKKVYDYAMSYKKMDTNYKMPIEVGIFLKLQDELKINSTQEAKKLITEYRTKRIKINKEKENLLKLQRQLNKLDSIKEEKLRNSKLFIHNIKFGGNKIDYENSNNEEFCINLPYTQEKIHIPKKYTAYNEKYQFYTLYLVDDKKYKVYDKNNNKIKEMTGTEIEKYVLNKKKEIDKLYN